MFADQQYEAIAKIIRQNKKLWVSGLDGHNACIQLQKGLIDYFTKNDPLFNREKFLRVCRL